MIALRLLPDSPYSGISNDLHRKNTLHAFHSGVSVWKFHKTELKPWGATVQQVLILHAVSSLPSISVKHETRVKLGSPRTNTEIRLTIHSL